MNANALRDRRALAGDQHGTAAIEFAVAGLCIITLLFGIVEIASYVADMRDLYNAVFRAGRYAIVHGSTSSSPASTATLSAQVSGNLRLLSASAVTASARFSPNNNPGSTVVITASYSWTPVVPLIPIPPITITATSAPVIIH